MEFAEREDTREFDLTEKLRVRYNGKNRNSVKRKILKFGKTVEDNLLRKFICYFIVKTIESNSLLFNYHYIIRIYYYNLWPVL